MADPLLRGRYPMRGLYQALAVAAMCLQEQAATRPLIGDVVTALTYLASQTYDPNATASQSNRVSSSTPRTKEHTSLGSGYDNPHANDSPCRNSPDLRQKDNVHGANFGFEVGRGEGSGSSGRKGGLEDLESPGSHRDSPVHFGKAKDNRNRNIDRERAVAEAKVWGENWRERRRSNAVGCYDGTNE